MGITFTVPQFLAAIVAAAGIPGAAIGFIVWSMQQKILKRDKERAEEALRYRQEREQKEADREQLELYLVESINASMALSLATAKAVQRIPDAHCNGDMHAALELATDAQKRQEAFLRKKGLQSIV